MISERSTTTATNRATSVAFFVRSGLHAPAVVLGFRCGLLALVLRIDRGERGESDDQDPQDEPPAVLHPGRGDDDRSATPHTEGNLAQRLKHALSLPVRSRVSWFAWPVTSGHSALCAQALDIATVFEQIAGLPRPNAEVAAIAEFADQFALDVSAIDGSQRSAFFATTGDQAFAVVQQIYAADFAPRVRSVLDAVFGPSTWPIPSPFSGDSWALLESFMTAVARLRAVDVTVTELVRLRGARLHDCAVCKSRRSRDAIDHGADDVAFAAVDDWPNSDLPLATKAALALVDALVWTPYDVPAETAAAAREHLSDAEIVEVVLDVMRNAANKIAVALGADGATVTDGVELFTTDADGNLEVVGQQ